MKILWTMPLQPWQGINGLKLLSAPTVMGIVALMTPLRSVLYRSTDATAGADGGVDGGGCGEPVSPGHSGKF